jgi:hypothetical protein
MEMGHSAFPTSSKVEKDIKNKKSDMSRRASSRASGRSGFERRTLDCGRLDPSETIISAAPSTGRTHPIQCAMVRSGMEHSLEQALPSSLGVVGTESTAQTTPPCDHVTSLSVPSRCLQFTHNIASPYCFWHQQNRSLLHPNLVLRWRTSQWYSMDQESLEKGDLKCVEDSMYRYDGLQWRRLCYRCDRFARPEFCRRHTPGLKHAGKSKTYSLEACQFLDRLSAHWAIPIRHLHVDPTTGDVKGREYEIPQTSYRVDGFVHSSNTVVEFLGDYWHGNPALFSSSKINHSTGKTFGVLLQQTHTRLQQLARRGYRVLYVWASEYKEWCRNMTTTGNLDTILHEVKPHEGHIPDVNTSENHLLPKELLNELPIHPSRPFTPRGKRPRTTEELPVVNPPNTTPSPDLSPQFYPAYDAADLQLLPPGASLEPHHPLTQKRARYMDSLLTPAHCEP